jgi:hypothetical protein
MLSGKPETGTVGPFRAGAAHDEIAIAQANGRIERFAPIGAEQVPWTVDRQLGAFTRISLAARSREANACEKQASCGALATELDGERNHVT